MIKALNQRIQKHFAFFGPKWFCWLMVFLGFQTWIVEGTFKALGYGEYGPIYNIIEFTDLALNTKNYFLFALLIIIISFIAMFSIINFPSFMFLLSYVFVEYYDFKGRKITVAYLTILLFPIWYLYLIFRFFS